MEEGKLFFLSNPDGGSAPSHRRAHRFRAAPYVFQLNGSHLRQIAISASLRFLIHGLSLRMKDNQPFALTAHLLRHYLAPRTM